jgi:hypothetical protein
MPSDLISNIRKKLQDRFTILANHPIEPRSRSLALSKSTAVPNDKDTNNSNKPNQYSRVKNLAKGEDIIKDDTD